MKAIKILFHRMAGIILVVLLQIMLLLVLFTWLSTYAPAIEVLLHLFSVVIILMIIKNSNHLSSDILWIVMISLFPVPATLFYFFCGADLIRSRTTRQLTSSTENSQSYYHQDEAVFEELLAKNPSDSGQFRYISKTSGFPFYRNTGFDYYGLGDTGYPVMLEELRKAKKFIFLEYFIIEEGTMWNGMLEILKEKAASGVEVRVMYDDLGTFTTLSPRYASQLESFGIKCISFNKINPILAVIMNHRDHRKIMVIDGLTAFSGGVNLADEYINVINKHGHWKDNVIRIKGEAVWSYTVMFLSHWNALRPEDDSFLPFKAEAEPGEPDGYIAPYGETPLDKEITAQNIYMGIVNQSNDYCYIMTPYLIIDSELINALVLAAKHGADIRIITPGIPDKKFVFEVTRSYYKPLIEGGVKIFEYTPGFVHAKVFVSDDVIATVGTVNLDYRSLYLHFENGTFLVDSKKIADIKQDVEEVLAQCHEVSYKECVVGPFREFWRAILRIFAPMM